ncbi:MAG: hypothetical protein WC281_18500, partial [Bosea sp. (in: a-proteobacteria)]
DAIAASLGERTEELRVLFDDKGVGMVTALGQRGDAIAAALGDREETLRLLFEDRGGGMVAALGQRGEAIANEVAMVGETVVRAIESRGSSIIEGLRERGAAITNALDTSSSGLRETLEHGTRQSVDALVKTNEQLRSELGGMLGRLGEANKLMQQIVNGANKNLAAVEGGLSARVGDLQSVIATVMDETGKASEQIAAQVADLKAFSEGTLRETTALVGQLDDKGASLGQVTQASTAALHAVASRLEQVEARVGKALAERQGSLEEIHGLIANRTDDVESITRSFAALMDESLSTAEARARQIGGVLSDSAEATTTAISQQFELIRATTGKERDRTAQALRQAYEQVSSEVGSELAKVTERFQGAAQDMRGVAAEIQRELEETRAELKRGVLDLPRETQESTSAMRRVVAEQIKALNELTEIVTRSGRRSDVALPVDTGQSRRSAASAQPRPEPAYATTTVTQARLPTAEAMELRPSLDATPEPATPAPHAEARPAPAPAPRPAPVQELPRRQPVPEAQSPAKVGWLSDLLNRASREEKAPETPKPTAHSIERLDSLSVDIARMIDHDAAVELWDRYKRGERNVFTRRLYTLQGQQTFDEIRRKYRRDAEFKETVDRYIDEFERLLAEAAKDDRDSIVAKTYLTSETGKVYTMLAHASGRFE